ncbi:MAG: hypothetical protein EP329_03870 [Deltaproteobacteria bacterium]|nr:MAG: hypothetical protein EP329_03870 [Deltaproteobacteria bacterium]
MWRPDLRNVDEQGALAAVASYGTMVTGGRSSVARLSPSAQRERVMERGRAFLDRHAHDPDQRAVMEQALTEVARMGGERIPCIHLPCAVHEAVTGDPDGGESLALVTVLAEAGIYTLDHLADRELGPHWDGTAAGRVQLAGVGFVAALPYLALAELNVAPALIVALQAELAAAYVAMWAGQARDLVSASATPEELLASVAGKTGERRAVYARMAARHAGADDATCERYGQLGHALGMVRQLSSDVVDLVAEPAASRDLASGTVTWPIGWALARTSGASREALKVLLQAARTDPEARRQAVAALVATGVMVRAKVEVERHAHVALEILRSVDAHPRGAEALQAMVADAAARFELVAAAAERARPQPASATSAIIPPWTTRCSSSTPSTTPASTPRRGPCA